MTGFPGNHRPLVRLVLVVQYPCAPAACTDHPSGPDHSIEYPEYRCVGCVQLSPQTTTSGAGDQPHAAARRSRDRYRYVPMPRSTVYGLRWTGIMLTQDSAVTKRTEFAFLRAVSGAWF